jgi:hypothetical protein
MSDIKEKRRIVGLAIYVLTNSNMKRERPSFVGKAKGRKGKSQYVNTCTLRLVLYLNVLCLIVKLLLR